jgi:hypothetical protein
VVRNWYSRSNQKVKSSRLLETYLIHLCLDIKMIAELDQILPKLGAKSCKTDTAKRESEEVFTVTAE